MLYKALGWEPPVFAHLPVFLNKGGGKLSKRQGAKSLLEYKDEGYLPEAVINFMAFLGWNPKTEQELFTLDELIEAFELKHVHKANPVFDTDKLDWYNSEYIKKMPLDELVALCTPYLPESADAEYIKSVVALEQDRLKQIKQIAEYTTFFFADDLQYETDLLNWKKNTPEQTKEYLLAVYTQLEQLEDWSQENLETTIIGWIKDQEFGNGDVLWPLRVSLTGEKASPSPFEVAGVLGKEKSLERIQKAMSQIES